MSAVRMGLALVAGMTVLLAHPASAQSAHGPMGSSHMFVEALGGAVVPTFDIANTAKTGAMVGVAFGHRLNDRWTLMGEFDYGHHKDKPTGTVSINTLHFMAKVGYSLTGPRERGWEALVNLGAGAVAFDVAGTTKTYPAINAGAKLTYNFSPRFSFVVSPQGDIAFTKKAEMGTTNAWVWPVSAGLRVRF